MLILTGVARTIFWIGLPAYATVGSRVSQLLSYLGDLQLAGAIATRRLMASALGTRFPTDASCMFALCRPVPLTICSMQTTPAFLVDGSESILVRHEHDRYNSVSNFPTPSLFIGENPSLVEDVVPLC